MTKMSEASQDRVGLRPPGEADALERQVRRVVAEQPADAPARFVLGMLALRDGRPDAATEALGAAVALDPANADFLCGLGAAHARLGRHDDAEAALRRALALRPDHPEARAELDSLLAAGGPSHVAANGPPPAPVPARREAAAMMVRQGRLDEAVTAYREAAREAPGDADLRNELGIILARQGRYADASDAYREAIRIRPDHPDAHNNLGNALRNQGKLDEAIESLRQAIRLRPNYPEAHNNLGIALKHRGKPDEAIASYHEALRQRPAYAEAHNNLGIALAERNQADGAIACYHQALRLKPDYFECWINLGNALGGRNRLPEAEEAYRRALRLRPDDAKAHRLLGVILARREKLDEAVAEHREAIRLRPALHDAHNDLGITLARLNRYEEAAESYRKAIEIRPKYAEAMSNLGNALRNLGRYDESLECYRKAIELKPSYADAHNNMGITFAEIGRFREAVESYTQCLKMRPNHVDAHMNRALTWLRDGDLARGWAEYEWRWKKRPVSPRPLIQPLWNGFPLEGMRILLITEQGLGDTMQFIRYAAALKERGATVILECPEKLLKILARTPGIDEVVPQGQPFPDYDFHVPLMSIPGLVGTSLATVPAAVPYIHPDPELVDRWRAEFDGVREFKVGINWQGNPKYAGDRHRSMPLARFEPLARVPGVRLYSLQKNAGHEQLAALAGKFPVVDLGARLDESSNPFMDTAAVMRNLDLFVTSDTAVAHLAGALGIRVWMATSLAAGWQWLSGREDSPWYPTMRLFRQEKLMEWEPVFARIAEALAAVVPPPPPEPIRIEATPAEVLDRVAALRVEAAHANDPAPASARLAALAPARERVLAEHPHLAEVEAELVAAHETLRRSERDLLAFEREGDFGPRFVVLARLVAEQRARRSELLRRADEAAPGP